MARGENPSQVERMRAQGYTEEEIADMLKCDKEIDRGANPFPLDPELEAGAKKARRADRTDTPKPRKREIDNERRFLIDALVWAVTTDIEQAGDNVLATDVEITNPEREFLFTYNGRKFKVTLSCPRSQGQDFALPNHIRDWAEFEYFFTFGIKFSKLFLIYLLTNFP